MDIKVGEIVSVRHSSGTKLLKGIVVEEKLETLEVKLFEEISLLNCFEGDPCVLGFEYGNEIFIASCNIIAINRKDNSLNLKIDSVDALTNKRISERFPVSFYADVSIGESKSKSLAIVKNISFTGILVCSKTEFPLYQKLKLNVDIGVKICLQVVIVRKSKELHNFEYGLKIVYTDVNTPNLIKKYLILLKKEHEDFIKKFKNQQKL